MSEIEVVFTQIFEKELERLSRKYPKTPDVIADFIQLLTQGDLIGDKIPNTGYDLYKARLPNPSAKKGKKGGFRVIYYVQVVERIVLITLYSKTQQADIAITALQQHIKDYLESLPPEL
jgi:mRNA-degrading endonuclease RelE of RelBE toxin-antitoxin system